MERNVTGKRGTETRPGGEEPARSTRARTGSIGGHETRVSETPPAPTPPAAQQQAQPPGALAAGGQSRLPAHRGAPLPSDSESERSASSPGTAFSPMDQSAGPSARNRRPAPGTPGAIELARLAHIGMQSPVTPENQGIRGHAAAPAPHEAEPDEPMAAQPAWAGPELWALGERHPELRPALDAIGLVATFLTRDLAQTVLGVVRQAVTLPEAERLPALDLIRRTSERADVLHSRMRLISLALHLPAHQRPLALELLDQGLSLPDTLQRQTFAILQHAMRLPDQMRADTFALLHDALDLPVPERAAAVDSLLGILAGGNAGLSLLDRDFALRAMRILLDQPADERNSALLAVVEVVRQPAVHIRNEMINFLDDRELPLPDRDLVLPQAAGVDEDEPEGMEPLPQADAGPPLPFLPLPVQAVVSDEDASSNSDTTSSGSGDRSI